MVIEFFKLRIRENTRSSVWNKNVIINILLGLFMLYMVACLLIMGLFLDEILVKASSGGNPVEMLNGLLIYYFGFELLVRFFMQSTPAMSIAPLLHLPVKRSFLMHFLLARSIINPLNYISFLIFLPFAIKAVSAIYSGAMACWWLLALFLLVVFVVYINVYIKRQMVVKPIVALCCGLVFAGFILLDFFEVFSLFDISTNLFGAILQQPLWILVPILLAAGAYLLNYRFLIERSYIEEIDRANAKKQVALQSLGFMSRFGYIGELIGLELKLIFRHKRTKSVLYLSPVIMLYGLLFYTNPIYKDSMMWLIFVSIFVTGFLMLAYGNFIVAWEGKYFDGILTREGNVIDYFRAKYYLLVSFCVVSYVLTTPYVLFGMRYLWFQTVSFLFNIGVGAIIVLWFAQFNRKRIELSQGTAFNWQGTSASQFLMMLPAIILPMLIAYIFKWVGLGDWGLGALALLGIIGVLCHKWIISGISQRFAQTKYAQAEGFRNN